MANNKKHNRDKFNLPKKRKTDIRKSVIKALAQDMLVEVPRHDSRFGLLRAVLEMVAAEDPELSEEQIRKSLYNLHNQGYFKEKVIRSDDEGAEIKFELTKKAKNMLAGYEFHDLEIEKPDKWDGKWRFVMFDIPEKSRYARDIFRDKLKSMKFLRIQQSVWVYPYPCKKEIDFISEFLGIRGGVLLFTGKVNRDAELRKHFKKPGT